MNYYYFRSCVDTENIASSNAPVSNSLYIFHEPLRVVGNTSESESAFWSHRPRIAFVSTLFRDSEKQRPIGRTNEAPLARGTVCVSWRNRNIFKKSRMRLARVCALNAVTEHNVPWQRRAHNIA